MPYNPFEVDTSLPWEEQKRIFKDAANTWKRENLSPLLTLKDFYKEHGQLTQPSGKGLQLKPKAKPGTENYPDYQPKLEETTQREVEKRNLANPRREELIEKGYDPNEVDQFLNEDKKKVDLINEQRTKADAISARGVQTGHVKDASSGGRNISGNLELEDAPLNMSKQHKSSPIDAAVLAEGRPRNLEDAFLMWKNPEIGEQFGDFTYEQKMEMRGLKTEAEIDDYLEKLFDQNGNGHDNGNGDYKYSDKEIVFEGGKVNGNGHKKSGFWSKVVKTTGATALISSVSFLPSAEAAEKTQEHLDNKEYKQAAITYGKDLIVGDVTGRASVKAFTRASRFFANRGLKRGLYRKLITMAGARLARKGIALAAGPAAPILLTALLIKDVYDVANVISRGKLNEGVKDLFTPDRDLESVMNLNLNIK